MQIFLLMGAICAFSFLISEAQIVSADPRVVTPLPSPSATSIPTGVTNPGPGLAVPNSFFESGVTSVDLPPLASGGTGQATVLGFKIPGVTAGTVPAHLIQGVVYAALAYFGGKMIGSMIGLSEDNSNSLGIALASGVGAYKAIAIAQAKGFAPGVFKTGFIGTHPFLSAAAIAIVIFVLLYKDEKKQTVLFQCLPWEPPLGGQFCDECNKDPLRPCSEYRCRSLGQACEIENKGTEFEQCVWKSKNDVTSPTITPNATALTSGLAYQPLLGRPTERGTKIVNSADSRGCLEAYTQLQFGVTTNEPAQCKIDYEEKELEALQFYFGGSNYFRQDHTQKMKLPSPADDRTDAPLFKQDGTFDLYVRCQDANGNVNRDVYVIEFCVNKGPDTTPPVIESTSILSGSAVQYDIDTVPLTAYINEPAECKWSVENKAYDNMENAFSCSTNPTSVNAELAYPCSTNLTGIENRNINDFYFRCRDIAGNTNVESYKFSLRGSQPLVITSISPNQTETIYGSTNEVAVQLSVGTAFGSDDGKAACFYNSTFTNGFTAMFETNSFTHRQQQELTDGTYTYNFRCVDGGGNIAEAETTFAVRVDKEAPMVTRVYRDNILKIVTNENAVCTYSLQSCSFNLAEGIQMEYPTADIKNVLAVEWNPQSTYYVKCTDSFGNQPADPNTCSVIVSPRSTSVK